MSNNTSVWIFNVKSGGTFVQQRVTAPTPAQAAEIAKSLYGPNLLSESPQWGGYVDQNR